MALRAGYYGIKRFFKDKLENIAKIWDETIYSKLNTSAFAPVQDGTNPSVNIGRGEFFIRGGKICICIQSMTTSSTFTKNTNYIELESYAKYEEPSLENLFTASEGVTLDGDPICARCGNVVYFSIAVNGVDATSEYEVGTFKSVPLEITTLMHITEKGSPFKPIGTALVRKTNQKLVVPAGTITKSTDIRIYGVIMFIYPSALVLETLNANRLSDNIETIPEELTDEQPVKKTTTRKKVNRSSGNI